MKLRKDLFPILVGLFLIFPTLFIIQNNVGRGIFIILSILLWIVLCIYTKKYIFSSLLYILFVLPYNITFQFPLDVLNIEPFVEGIYSNYLVPTVSILDVGGVLLIFSFVFTDGFKRFFKRIEKLKLPLVVLSISLLVLNIYHWDFLVLLTTVRFFSVILVITLLVSWFEKNKEMEIRWVLGVLIFNLLFQGILGILQFDGGSSLGLSFLGESQVVNGMQGSSFISLNDGIYLRAYGTFPHPNVLGGYLLMCFTAIWLFLPSLKRYWKYLRYLGVSLCVIFSLFTFSRITILLMGIGVFLFGISETGILKRFKKSSFNSFSFGLLIERFLNLLTGGDTSWSDRWNLMLSSFQVIRENLLFGSGLGRYVKYMEGFVPRTRSSILLIQPVHNIFLLIFAELGLLGFLSLLYWFVEYFRKFASFKKNFCIKIFILMLFLIFGMFDHFWFSLPQGLYMSAVLVTLLAF